MPTHLISNQGYLDSVRYLGLTTIDSICELIDNSFDANAQNINITISRNEKFTITLEDDGDGIEKESIDKVLSFGGRIPSRNEHIVGKFGWGLPSAACCQSIRTEVYSKTQTSNDWLFSYIDLFELSEMREPMIPDSIEKSPPFDTTYTHGTIIILDNLDNPDYQKEETLKSHLSSIIGEIYRHYLNNGRTVTINNEFVEIVDPLMLIKDCKDANILWYAHEYSDIDPILFEDIIDPITNKPAQIDIKIAILDLEKLKKRDDYLSVVRSRGFNVNNQWFYIIRQKRQIARAMTLNIFQRHNSLNYFRAEISFSPALDRYFWVQTNKSRFSLNPNIREKLEEKIENSIAEIRKIAKDFHRSSNINKTNEWIPYSEKIAAEVDKDLRPNTINPTPEEIEKVEIINEQERKKEIGKIEKDITLDETEKVKKKNIINNKFQSFRPFEIDLIENEYAPFYDFKPHWKASKVSINIFHPFYTKIYERAIENKTSAVIDLLLFSLAKAEAIHYSNETIRKFYKEQRLEWSTILQKYLEQINEPEEED